MTVHVEVEHHFAQIPEVLLYDPKISAEAVRVYGVLLRHGQDPANCYPSHRRIAEKIGRSARSVPTWVKELEDAGWLDRIARERPDGSPDSNGYRIYAFPRGRAGERGVRAPEGGPLPADERAPSTPGSAPKESQVNESKGNEKTRGGAPGQLALVADERPPPAERERLTLIGFDAFWRVYPRREGKGAARRKWEQAIRKARAEDIIAGAQRYADDPNRSAEFTAHASTWLHGERWGDDPLPARGTTGPRSSTARTMDAARALLASGAHRTPALEAGR